MLTDGMLAIVGGWGHGPRLGVMVGECHGGAHGAIGMA